MKSDSSSQDIRRENGFALVLTVALLSLLVAVAVILATVVKVESRAIGNARSQALARHNAKIGLRIAISELQRTAGADRRVTGRSELESGVPIENSHWTGVWGGLGPEPEWLISAKVGSLDPSGFDPISGKSPLHYAGDVHAAALKKAISEKGS